jgi:hypothetical protein
MQERAEFLLELSSAKVEKLEKALERNWIAHLILAGIGLAFVFDVGDVPRSFAKYFSQDQYNIRLAAVLIPPILLYHFMKLGHLLTSFIQARTLHDELLNAYLSDTSDKEKFRPLRETSSFFEVFYSTRAFGGPSPVVFAYFAVTPAVIAAAQAAALFLILQAYGYTAWSIGVVGLCAVVLIILYWAFWVSQRNHPHSTKVVIGCILLVIAWLILFASLA